MPKLISVLYFFMLLSLITPQLMSRVLLTLTLGITYFVYPDILSQYVPHDSLCLEMFARNLTPHWTSWGNEVRCQSFVMNFTPLFWVFSFISCQREYSQSEYRKMVVYSMVLNPTFPSWAAFLFVTECSEHIFYGMV